MEAGIGFTTLPKLKRGDEVTFLGQQALHAKHAAGLQRRLVTLVLDDPGGPDGVAPPLHGGEGLLRNGECIGFVRSSAYGHTLGRSIVTGKSALSINHINTHLPLTSSLPTPQTPGYVDCPEGVPKITPKWLREGSWAVQSKLKEPMTASLHLKPPFDPDGKRMKGEYEDKEEELKAATA